jgi:hypothetical protein
MVSKLKKADKVADAGDTMADAGNLTSDLSKATEVADDATPQILKNKEAGDAARDLIAASRPGSVVEQNFRVTGGLRRVDVVDERTAIESKVGRTNLGKKGSRERQELARDIKLMRSGQVDSVEWHFSPSAKTGKSGPTKPLRNKLEKFGIPIVEYK